ncbi:flagellar hook-length control protein FliK [Echinimonas agarilytica]|uniref:Flagellar hook-length control protein FliK n=1 Tax=Echinimonas agarilytica TaxID=1215918 RepID=A0AA42B6P0_9GAMM|nr:flagellar hook-length control protein FliK [Echinimonas agarilytica]
MNIPSSQSPTPVSQASETGLTLPKNDSRSVSIPTPSTTTITFNETSLKLTESSPGKSKQGIQSPTQLHVSNANGSVNIILNTNNKTNVNPAKDNTQIAASQLLKLTAEHQLITLSLLKQPQLLASEASPQLVSIPLNQSQLVALANLITQFNNIPTQQPQFNSQVLATLTEAFDQQLLVARPSPTPASIHIERSGDTTEFVRIPLPMQPSAEVQQNNRELLKWLAQHSIPLLLKLDTTAKTLGQSNLEITVPPQPATSNVQQAVASHMTVKPVDVSIDQLKALMLIGQAVSVSFNAKSDGYTIRNPEFQLNLAVANPSPRTLMQETPLPKGIGELVVKLSSNIVASIQWKTPQVSIDISPSNAAVKPFIAAFVQAIQEMKGIVTTPITPSVPTMPPLLSAALMTPTSELKENWQDLLKQQLLTSALNKSAPITSTHSSSSQQPVEVNANDEDIAVQQRMQKALQSLAQLPTDKLINAVSKLLNQPVAENKSPIPSDPLSQSHVKSDPTTPPPKTELSQPHFGLARALQGVDISQLTQIKPSSAPLMLELFTLLFPVIQAIPKADQTADFKAIESLMLQLSPLKPLFTSSTPSPEHSRPTKIEHAVALLSAMQSYYSSPLSAAPSPDKEESESITQQALSHSVKQLLPDLPASAVALLLKRMAGKLRTQESARIQLEQVTQSLSKLNHHQRAAQHQSAETTQTAQQLNQHMTIPVQLNGDVQLFEILIQQQPQEDQSSSETSSKSWHLKLRFDLPNTGAILVHALYGPDGLDLDIYADKISTQQRAEKALEGWRERLNDLGFRPRNLTSQQGNVPDRLVSSIQQLVNTEA